MRDVASQTLGNGQPQSSWTNPTGIWVDEAHAVLRRGMVSTLVSDGFTVCGESSALRPIPNVDSVAILIFEADGPALRALLPLTRERPIHLIATMHAPSQAQLFDVAEAGVAAILLQHDLTPELLTSTIRAVEQGRTSLPRDLLPRLLTRAAEISTKSPGTLSDREREVLRMVADGEDTRAIAMELCYSERTVKNVVHDVLTKLNCRTRAQAVGLATRAGVI
jgi:DNA-binding NarL/FixJ family response regulator